jgi:hypothetical protein
MVGIGKGGWTVVLVIVNVLVLLILVVLVFSKPSFITTGILRVSPILPPSDPNSETEMAQFMSLYEAYKSTVAGRLVSDGLLNMVVYKLDPVKLDYFDDAPNRIAALRQAIKSKQIVIDIPRQSDRITVRMTECLPSEAETIVNCFMDSCVAIENAKPQTLLVLEDQRQKLLLKMEQPDQKDRARDMYNEVTRRIDDVKAKSRLPGLVQIDSRAQSVPRIPFRKQRIFAFAGVEAFLLLALVGNCLWMFLRPPGRYQSPHNNT